MYNAELIYNCNVYQLSENIIYTFQDPYCWFAYTLVNIQLKCSCNTEKRAWLLKIS